MNQSTTRIHSAMELWSDVEPSKPCLIMGNSMSVRHFQPSYYDRWFTIGGNSRLHREYVPDLTMMVDPNIPKPDPDCDIATHLDVWKNQHTGDVYTYSLGKRLQFHPDLSTTSIDFSVTSIYMAICFAYHMGYRTFTFVGVDLCQVDGKDRMDSPGSGVDERRKKFFNMCFNHLSFLINKMARYHKCRFYSLSPNSQLLMNGFVTRAEVTNGFLR